MGEVGSAGEFSRTRRTRVKWHGLHALWRSRHVGPRRQVNGRADTYTHTDTDADANTDTYADADADADADANTNSCAQ